jgi:hypothetical protein
MHGVDVDDDNMREALRTKRCTMLWYGTGTYAENKDWQRTQKLEMTVTNKVEISFVVFYGELSSNFYFCLYLCPIIILLL